MAPGRFADQPLADWASTICARHFRVGARFVNEYQLLGVKLWLICLPAFARLRDVGSILFRRVQRFF